MIEIIVSLFPGEFAVYAALLGALMSVLAVVFALFEWGTEE